MVENMASIKNRVVEVFTTPSLTPKNSDNSKLITAMCRDLPPHFKLLGVDDKDRQTQQEPSFLLVVGVSALSMGKVFEAFHTGNYERIIVADIDVHEFDIKQIILDFMKVCTYRGLERIGTIDRNEITRKLDSFVMIKNGSDLIKTLDALDGQLNEVSAKKRVESLEAKNQVAQTDIKEERIKDAAKHGVAGMMEALEGLI